MADLSYKLFVQSRIYGHNSDQIIIISNNSKLVDRTFELFSKWTSLNSLNPKVGMLPGMFSRYVPGGAVKMNFYYYVWLGINSDSGSWQ